MAPTLVNSGTFVTTVAASTGTFTLGWTPTPGNALIVTYSGDGTTNPHISALNLGGTVGNFADVTATNNEEATGIWWCPNMSAGQASTSLNFTTAGGTGTCSLLVTVMEWAGLSSTADKTNSGFSASTASAWSSGASGTLAQASELAIGVVSAFHTTTAPTITGPSSPWTNIAGHASALTLSQMTGWQVVSATTSLTYSGTVTSGSAYDANIATFEAAPAITTSGGVTLKPALAGTGAGGDTTTSGGLTLKPALAGAGGETFAATGGVTLLPQLAGTSLEAPPFPASQLGIKVELLINGTWTDVTSKLRQSTGVVITLGRQNETVTMQPASCMMMLDNRDSSFSPYDPAGPFYPYITRNTQIRVSVTAASMAGTVYSGYRFWGEVPSWPPGWNVGATERHVTVTAAGIMQRLNQNRRNIGSPLYRYYSKLTGAAAPVAYWPCEDASSATQFASSAPGGTAMMWTGTPSLSSDTSIAGSDAFAQLNGSTWTGAVSGVATPSPAVYTSPGFHFWTCPGDVTSLTSAEALGSGSGASGGSANFGFLGGGGAAYAKIVSVAVTPGTVYTLFVAAGGHGTSDLSTSGDGATSHATFDSATVAAVGGKAPSGNTPGKGGLASASTGTTKHSGGDGGTASQAGGAGGGSSGGSSADGNDGGNSSSNSGGSAGSAPTGGGKGGKGGDISMPGQSGGVPGGGGGGAGGGGTGTALPGGNGGAGQIKLVYTSTGAPAANVLRFVLDVPAAGGTNGAILAEMTGSGTITTVDVVYGTGGTLQVIGYNISHVSKFTHTSGAICNGVPMMVSVSLVQSGSGVAWSFDYIKPGDVAATNISSGTVTSSTVGGAVEFDGNVGGTEVTGVGLGQVTIQYAVSPLADMGAVLAGYAGEHAADRLFRLCTEEGISFELTGGDFDTPQMGPQVDGILAALLQECEDADRGQLFETQDAFGLGYRTRVSMQNQAAGATISYNDLGEAVPQPVNDEMLIRNDVTITRPSGSSYEATLMTGPLSVLDPPNGVGPYAYGQTVNLFADSQLQNCATWVLDVGTFDDFRWPVIEADLLSPRNTGANFADLPGLGIGDLLEVDTPPSFVQSSSVKQLIWGRKEVLNAKQWKFDFNCVPEAPYEGAGLPTW